MKASRWAAAGANPLLRHYRFPAQQDEAHDSLDVFLSQAVFVAKAGPVENV